MPNNRIQPMKRLLRNFVRQSFGVVDIDVVKLPGQMHRYRGQAEIGNEAASPAIRN